MVGDCETADEFEARLSDIADALDSIKVDESLIPEEKRNTEETKGSLNQLKVAIKARQEADADEVLAERAIQTLQRVRFMRHTQQHSGAARERPRVLRELGVPDSGLTFSETLSRIRTRTAEALLALRTEIRRTIPD